MVYKITARNKGTKAVQKARGVKELHTSLASLRANGYSIRSIARI